IHIALKVDSELFHVLTQIQDEVHRFAIEFHRNKRSRRALQSELDNITGIGPKTRDGLLNALKSVKKIREAELETLSDIIGPSKAQIVYNYFHQTVS
ncbi:MAG: excinuclease ABC subunit C, partial [Prevotella sp.]|nr:excinuclease ABC subunit C [Prevotella sp.]